MDELKDNPVTGSQPATINSLKQENARLRYEIVNLEAQLAGKKGGAPAVGRCEIRKRDLAEFAAFTVESMSDGVFLIAEDATIVYVNNAACRQLGYAREELLQLCIFDINPSLTPQVWTAVWGVTVNDKIQTIEVEHRTKDGRVVPVEVLANFIELDGVQYSCSFTRDITNRRELEARIRQSEKMEAIGQLAGGIAHDFNNQLTGMLGFAEMLRMDLGDRLHLKHDVDGIISAIHRSSALTAQLLAFARQGKYMSVPVNLHKVIGETVRMLERSIDKNIRMVTAFEAPSAVTAGDPVQLENALLNLAINARDAMPLGGELTFATRIVDIDEEYCARCFSEIKPGAYVRLSVGDTGIGMSKLVLSRLFEPFFTTKERGKGTGMGLASVYGTVKNHKGAIEVQSLPGKGTTVTVYLPCSPVAAGRGPVDRHSQAGKSLAARVLLVDDEPLVRDAAKEMLERLGCTVITAINGIEAVDIYKSSFHELDVVILDLILPEMGGKDAFFHMRAINPDLVAIIASGYSGEQDVREIIKGGARGFLQKPFDFEALSGAMATIIGRYGGAG